jgi:hypothetical protein
MGIRQIRYCDISGTEEGPGAEVDSHELHIDQMGVRIDLAAGEYRKLLQLLRPYIDAGRVEASTPPHLMGLPSAGVSRTRGAGVTGRGGPRLSAEERDQLVRWAADRDIPVPTNKKFKNAIIEQWRREHTPVESHTEQQV